LIDLYFYYFVFLLNLKKCIILLPFSCIRSIHTPVGVINIRQELPTNNLPAIEDESLTPKTKITENSEKTKTTLLNTPILNQNSNASSIETLIQQLHSPENAVSLSDSDSDDDDDIVLKTAEEESCPTQNIP
jgi:hypothetical protein